mmetsp:Transcript_21873/g.45530  ORF Transcript_21873/g.45530 Transcript_21873/m.45530 type:complete len:207 (-) Transcript_21873:221-841(-)
MPRTCLRRRPPHRPRDVPAAPPECRSCTTPPIRPRIPTPAGRPFPRSSNNSPDAEVVSRASCPWRWALGTRPSVERISVSREFRRHRHRRGRRRRPPRRSPSPPTRDPIETTRPLVPPTATPRRFRFRTRRPLRRDFSPRRGRRIPIPGDGAGTRRGRRRPRRRRVRRDGAAEPDIRRERPSWRKRRGRHRNGGPFRWCLGGSRRG